MSDTPEPDERENESVVGDDSVRIHRAPRYFRFMVAGGVVGLIVALILTFSFPEPPGFDFSQVFGFLALFLAVFGFAVGAVVALLVDRASRRAARTVMMEHVEGGENPEGIESPAGTAIEQSAERPAISGQAEPVESAKADEPPAR
ncbi:hypothetical protein [Subtercola lobariae]|uniref:Potassium transporter Trk n=1 Tax=Subtercola lobariae TaxID=1588641 RepID=A0A917B8H6_9MICO|nr:hypothetical protein [Subtercola lobariae]GGF29764.1 hypothetical protein GCM10011399_23660 [Subtercola lobariae]